MEKIKEKEKEIQLLRVLALFAQSFFIAWVQSLKRELARAHPRASCPRPHARPRPRASCPRPPPTQPLVPRGPRGLSSFDVGPGEGCGACGRPGLQGLLSRWVCWVLAWSLLWGLYVDVNHCVLLPSPLRYKLLPCSCVLIRCCVFFKIKHTLPF